MANLLNVEEKDKKKALVKKGIILTVCIVALILAALIHCRISDAKYEEDITDVQICVHIKGAVKESGLYYVPFGTRVNNLGEYAGGFLENADLDGVNLAEFVKDGDEVYIPFKGSADIGGYNLNTVTAEELVDKVEGIGETYANKIVAYRESRGGFTTVSELKSIVGESVYEKIREKFYIE